MPRIIPANPKSRWIFDFTLAELRTLKLVIGQHQDARPMSLSGILNITTLEEMINQLLVFNLRYHGTVNPNKWLCGLQ